MLPKKYVIKHKYTTNDYGFNRRQNLTKEILKDGTPFPKTLTYSDIDSSFKEFVDTSLGIAYDGVKIPTFVLLSNQRISEYAQTWKYVDTEKNILMNFKTITRDNNPMPGENQGGLWNIPGNRMYPLAKVPVLDKNGTESMLLYKMRQPYCVDLLYSLTLVTNKYDLLNKFNEMVNNEFKARQCYIRPNDHFIPMIIEDITDESEYNIDDRKFFSQTYHIKAMAYILKEEDFEVEQLPLRGVFMYEESKNRGIDIVVDESEEWGDESVSLTITFESFIESTKFNIDTDMKVKNIDMENIRYFRIHVNDVPIYPNGEFSLKEGDLVRVKIKKLDINKKSVIIFNS